jgi:serine/threonine protein phosphatase PrpC
MRSAHSGQPYGPSPAALADQRGAQQTEAEHLGALKFRSAARTHIGCVRSLNEDAYLDRPDIGLWSVADGMGGHEAGDIASAMLIEALGGVSEFRSAYGFHYEVCRALQGVNEELWEQGDDLHAGLCGSTVAALLVHDGHFASIWAGDSRVYLYREGEIRRLTRDHSVVQNLVDAGELKDEERHAHSAAHIVTRAVGAAEVLELESVHGVVVAGDRFLLCTDGLTNLVRDSELRDLLRRPSLEASLDEMVALALERGGHDNLTALLVAAEPRG